MIIETLEKAEKKGNELILVSNQIYNDLNLDSKFKVTLTLEWENSTGHYIFRNRKKEVYSIEEIDDNPVLPDDIINE